MKITLGGRIIVKVSVNAVHCQKLTVNYYIRYDVLFAEYCP